MTADLISLERNVQDAYEIGVCKQVGDELERHYPGWMWMVSVPPKGGVVQIRSGYMDPRQGFVVKLVASYSASHLAREAVRAGGELLERVNMPRSKYEYDREMAASNKTLHHFLTFQR
jgi:hypothetical protein